VCCVRPVDRPAMHVGISTCWAGFSFLSRPEPYTSIPVNSGAGITISVGWSLLSKKYAPFVSGAFKLEQT